MSGRSATAASTTASFGGSSPTPPGLLLSPSSEDDLSSAGGCSPRDFDIVSGGGDGGGGDGGDGGGGGGGNNGGVNVWVPQSPEHRSLPSASLPSSSSSLSYYPTSAKKSTAAASSLSSPMARFWKTPSKQLRRRDGDDDDDNDGRDDVDYADDDRTVLPLCNSASPPLSMRVGITPDAKLGLTMRRIRNGITSPFRSSPFRSSLYSSSSSSSSLSSYAAARGPSTRGRAFVTGCGGGASKTSAAAVGRYNQPYGTMSIEQDNDASHYEKRWMVWPLLKRAIVVICFLSATALVVTRSVFSSTVETGGIGDDSDSAPFRFRPVPIPGSESARAVSLVRDAFNTRRSDGALSMDDPMNPGSIFVVMELREEMVEAEHDGSNEANGRDEAINSNSAKRRASILEDEAAKNFALGYEPYLSDRIRRLWKLRASQTMTATVATKGDIDDVGVKDENKEGSDAEIDLVEATSYYSLTGRNLPHVARSLYASADGRSALVEIRFSMCPPIAATDSADYENDEVGYVASVTQYVREYGDKHKPKNIGVTIAGLPTMQLDLLSSSSSSYFHTRDNWDSDAGRLDSVVRFLSPGPTAFSSYRFLAERFGWGRIAPYRIVFYAKERSGESDQVDKSVQRSSVYTDASFRIIQRVVGELSAVDAKVESTEELKEDMEEAVLTGIAAVNLDSIPQRIEDGHLMEHLTEVMDELYGSTDTGVVGGLDESAFASSGVFGGGGLRGMTGRHLIRPHTRTTYDGAAYLRNNPVPFPLFVGSELCAERNGGTCPIELLQYLVHMARGKSSVDGTATYVTATLGVDPFSAEGVAWLEAAREKLKMLEEKGTTGNLLVAIEGGASLEYDAEVARRVAAEKAVGESWWSPLPLAWTTGLAVAVIAAAAAAATSFIALSLFGTKTPLVDQHRGCPMGGHHSKKV